MSTHPLLTQAACCCHGDSNTNLLPAPPPTAVRSPVKGGGCIFLVMKGKERGKLVRRGSSPLPLPRLSWGRSLTLEGVRVGEGLEVTSSNQLCTGRQKPWVRRSSLISGGGAPPSDRGACWRGYPHTTLTLATGAPLLPARPVLVWVLCCSRLMLPQIQPYPI